MGSSCSKNIPEKVSQIKTIVEPKLAHETHSFDDQFVIEKVDHTFITNAFGTNEKDKWNLDHLSRVLKHSIKKLEELQKSDDSESLVKLPPVLNPDGSVYFGQWKNDKFDGKGHLFMPDGSQYIGTFFEGKFNGPGEIVFINGDTFKGMFSGGNKHGKGVLKFKNGDVFEGMWNKGCRHGYGVERLADGTVFMGNFKNNKRYGHGELKNSDGTHYEGNFHNNAISGTGKMYWPNGESYTGSFKNGLKHGHGTTMWKTGDTLSHKGLYKDGKMNGNFKSVMRDGSVVEAHYEDDKFVRYLEEDEKKLLTRHSSRYSGTKSPRSLNSNDSKSLNSIVSSKSLDGLSETKVSSKNEFDEVSDKSPLENEVEKNSNKQNFEKLSSKETPKNKASTKGSPVRSSGQSTPRYSTKSTKYTSNQTYNNTGNTEGSFKKPNLNKLSRDFSKKFPDGFTKYNSRDKLTNGFVKSSSTNFNKKFSSKDRMVDETGFDTHEVKSENKGFVRNQGPTSRGRFSTRSFRGRRGSSRVTN